MDSKFEGQRQIEAALITDQYLLVAIILLYNLVGVQGNADGFVLAGIAAVINRDQGVGVLAYVCELFVDRFEKGLKFLSGHLYLLFFVG